MFDNLFLSGIFISSPLTLSWSLALLMSLSIFFHLKLVIGCGDAAAILKNGKDNRTIRLTICICRNVDCSSCRTCGNGLGY